MPAKICNRCGKDVSQLERFKDQSGRYWCAACNAEITKPANRANTPPPSSGGRANSATTAGSSASATSAGPVGKTANFTPLRPQQLGLMAQVTCPHCWSNFAPEKLLWVAQHADLMGDPVLGPEKPSRFLPTRFNLAGQAIDARGMACQIMACPHCHLHVPRQLTESRPLFVSLVGAPASGKSYFLTAMSWELRKILPSEFGMVFSDTDNASNRALNEYEETLFLSEDPNRLANIRKTELQGDNYDQINSAGQVVLLPRPFLFSMRPGPRHPLAAQGARVGHIMCLYDNAGESFQVGMDSVGSPVTQHLAQSKAVMFLFDPTQDARFRERCRAVSSDPQLARNRTQRQETLLIEAAQRVRRFSNLSERQRPERPLLVLVSKSDVWAPLLKEDVVTEPVLPSEDGGMATVDVARIEKTSRAIHDLLARWLPEFVGAAEDFSQNVVYIPVSALGGPPQLMPGGEGLGVRPGDITPRWVTAPVLYMFAKWTSGLIKSNVVGPRPPGDAGASNGNGVGEARSATAPAVSR